MNRAVFLILTASALSSLALADQINLKNGDKITGAIVKKDGANLVVKSAAAGMMTIPWDQVASIATDGSVTVVLSGNRTVQSQITGAGGGMMVGGTQVAVGDIVTIRDAAEQHAFERLEHPGWGALWAGTAGLNLAGTTGNSETKSFVVNMNAARVTRTDKTTIYFTAINSSATINTVSTQTAQAVRGGVGYSRNLTPKVFVNVFNDWEYDKFQDLDLRFVFGGGIGYHVWKTDRGFLDLLGGIDYAHDKYGAIGLATLPVCTATLTTNCFTPEATKSRAELYYGDDFGYKLNPRTSFTQSFRMFHNFSDFGAYRMNFDAGANTQITKWLTWNVGVSDRYLAQPVAGRKNNDFIYSTGVGVTFAR